MLDTIFRKLGRAEESDKYGELAIKRAIEASRSHPDWSRPAQLAASTLAGFGRREEAVEWLERALMLDPDDGQTLYNGACVWSLLGNADRAFELLERWLPNAGLEKRMWLVQDADFDPIRDDPRFKQLEELASA